MTKQCQILFSNWGCWFAFRETPGAVWTSLFSMLRPDVDGAPVDDILDADIDEGDAETRDGLLSWDRQGRFAIVASRKDEAQVCGEKGRIYVRKSK